MNRRTAIEHLHDNQKDKIKVYIFSPHKLKVQMAEKEKKFTDLAEFLGVSKQTTSTYAVGTSTPNTNTFFRILAFVGCAFEQLCDVNYEDIPVEQEA